MCNTLESRTTSSNSEFLTGEISLNQKNLDDIRAVSQSIISWIHWSGDKSHPPSSIIVMDTISVSRGLT